MQLYRALAFSLTALTAPLAAQAQTNDPLPRFYGGLLGSFGGYPLPEGDGENVATVVPLLGFQLRTRLAVQASAALDTNHNLSYYSPAPGQEYSASRRRTLVVPVLARYTLTRRPARRVHFDVLGGLSLVHSVIRRTVSEPDNMPAPLVYQQTLKTTGLCLTLGPAVRCAVWKGLEITGEAVFNRQVKSEPRLHWANPNLAAGLLYRFGRRA